MNSFLFQSIGTVYTGMMQALGASHKVFEYMDRKPEILPPGTFAPQHLAGKIEFEDVTFAYPTRKDTAVLKVCSVHCTDYRQPSSNTMVVLTT